MRAEKTLHKCFRKGPCGQKKRKENIFAMVRAGKQKHNKHVFVMVRASRKNASGDFENLSGKVLIHLLGDSSKDKQMKDREISTLPDKFSKTPLRTFAKVLIRQHSLKVLILPHVPLIVARLT